MQRLNLAKDEVLAVHSGCTIVDDEVHTMLDFGDQSSVLAVLDCCHSATMADLQYQYVPGALDPADSGVAEEEPTKSTRSSAKPLHRVVTISGCGDTQESKMSKLDGEVVGNLSKALLLAWRAPGGFLRPFLGSPFAETQKTVLALSQGTQRPALFSSFMLAAGATPFDPRSWAV
eukprot:SAG22_NODE_4121_length_1378_cov_1.222048_2_plen_175_part_00